MVRTWSLDRKCTVAAGVAIAFLATSLASTRSSRAGSAALQDPGKVTQKVETKVEVQKQVVQEKAAAKVEAVAPMIMIKQAVGGRIVVPANGQPDENGEEMVEMRKQFAQLFRPLLHSELRLLTSAAEPSATQRREIALSGGKAVAEASVKMATAQQGMNVGRGMNGIPDPRQMIRDAMEAAAREKLSNDQFARYKTELELKVKDQKEVVLMNIVANLDKAMILSSDQRDKLRKSIQAQWDDRTYPSIETATIYEAYFPIIPNQVLSPILSDEQMKIWKGLPKIQFASVRNYNFFNNQQNVPANDDDDEDVKAAMASIIEVVKKK